MRNFNNDRSRGNRRSDHSGRSQMHDAVCDECGKNCKVPFMPTSGKPIYCSECFEKRGNGRDDRRSSYSDRSDRSERRGPSHDRPQKNYDQQFQVLNDKLDQILEILSNQVDSNILVEETKPKKKRAKKIEKVIETPTVEETKPELDAIDQIVEAPTVPADEKTAV